MNKEEQKQLIIDIMNEDAKDGLYKQQTAVEWLKQELEAYGSNSVKIHCELFNKAKEMEKEQIIEAHVNGQEISAVLATTGKKPQTSLQYYNQEYGGKK